MFIKPGWRILTIGDGDLSFSLALANRYQPAALTATVLDSEAVLTNKYALNALSELRNKGCRVLFEVDITQPESFHGRLGAEYDLVIFQFPLVPNAGPLSPGKSFHHSADSNLLNRILLARTLEHSFAEFLDPQGRQLCYITSKDVKPYCDWQIESLGEHLGIEFLGTLAFLPGEFPGYRLRNVDRDKQVKATAATTYVWGNVSDSDEVLTSLRPVPQKQNNYCHLCKVGPITTPRDLEAHLNSRQHKRKAKYQQHWLTYLEKEEGKHV